MSKKLLSAILAVAMIVSLCTTLFTASVGAAATANEDARAALKAAIQELYIKGPKVADETRQLLIDTGILTAVSDKTYYAEDKTRSEVFNTAVSGLTVNDKYDGSDLDYFFTSAGLTSFVGTSYYTTYGVSYESEFTIVPADNDDKASDAINAVMILAASAYKLDENPDLDIADAAFNAGRNTSVKSALDLVKGILSALKGNVGDNAAGKPGYVSDTVSTGYAAVFNSNAWQKYAVSQYSYNTTLGVNPFYALADFTLFSQFSARWYTLAELRADSTTAPLLLAFEKAYSSSINAKVNGVLFYDFITGNVNGLSTAWSNLAKAVIAKAQTASISALSAINQIRSFNNLKKVYAVYNTYVATSYINNIYAASTSELYTNILTAKMLIDYVNAQSADTKAITCYVVGSEYFDNLTNKIIAGIAAVNPSASYLGLCTADVTSGVALVKQAEILLNVWYNWKDSSTSSCKTAYANLAAATAFLKNMLPYAAGESVDLVIAKDSSDPKIKDFDKTELNVNDKIVVTFVPNAASFMAYYTALEAELATFNTTLNNFYTQGTLPSGAVDANKGDLETVLKKYAYLAGYLNDVTKLFDSAVANNNYAAEQTAMASASNLRYQWAIGLIYAQITGAGTAATQYNVFKTMVTDAIEVYYKGLIGTSLTGTTWQTVTNVYSTWDIENGTFSSYVNGYQAIASQITGFIKYLTVDLTKLIQTYQYNMETLYNFFVFQDTEVPTLYTSNTAAPAGAPASTGLEYVCYTVNATVPGMPYSVTSHTYTSTGTTTVDDWGTPVDAPVVVAVGNYQIAANYSGYKVNDAGTAPKAGLYYNMLKAQEALDDNITALGSSSTDATNFVNINAAYTAFISSVKALLTERGDALVDQYLNDVSSWLLAQVSTSTTIYTGLEAANYANNLALPTAATEPYLYYLFTVKYVAESLNAPNTNKANQYSFDGATNNTTFIASSFYKNIYKRINDVTTALSTYDASKYDTEWAARLQTIRTQCAQFLNLVSLGTDAPVAAPSILNNSDIPLWYVLNLRDAAEAVSAEKSAHSVEAIELYKVQYLDPVLTEAYGKNAYDYVTTTDEGKTIWAAYTAAYTDALTVRHNTRTPKTTVDATVEALTKAITALTAIAKPSSSTTIASLDEKIAAAEALYARCDLQTSKAAQKAVPALNEAILAAKAARKDLQYSISLGSTAADIDAEIADLDTAMSAASDSMFFAEDLVKKVKVLMLTAESLKDKYVAATYTAFVDAANAALALEGTELKTSEYVAAYDAVSAKYKALEVIVITSSKTRDASLKKYNELAAEYSTLTGYTQDSMLAYKAALTALKAGVDSYADDTTLLDLISKVYLAKAKLAAPVIDNPVTCED